MAGVRVGSDKGLMALVAAVLVMCGGGTMVTTPVPTEPQVPAVYIFGDSTVDVGNNLYLPANDLYPLPPPYGIDFLGNLGPNGRVSNGYNLGDTISRRLGFDMSPPAYLSLSLSVPPETSQDADILSGLGGVNYASGGSGILDQTGGNKSLSMRQQVEFFAATKSKMIGDAIDTRLSESLFLINSGGNDMFEYLLTLQNTSTEPEPVSDFYRRLGTNYRNHLNTLYDLGARRFGIVDVPPIGCVPALRNTTDGGACKESANLLANVFNQIGLGQVMRNFKDDTTRPGITYSVGSSYNVLTRFRLNPQANWFSEVASACCGGGRLGVNPWCSQPDSTFCDNRDDYLYWDGAHSTEVTARRGAALFFDAPVSQGLAWPINFSQLVSPTDGSDRVSSS